MRTITITAAVMAALLLAACEGGGGGSPTITPEAAPQSTSLVFPLTSGDIQHAGIEQASSHLDHLPTAGARAGVSIRYGTLIDGAGSATVAAYLDDATYGVVSRFTTAPEVQVIGASTAREREIVAAAVEAINLSLPPELRMQIGPPDQDLSLQGSVDHAYGGQFFGWADIPPTRS